MPEKPVEEVLARHTGEWMSIPGVVGVAQGEQNSAPCIVVYVKEMTEEIKRRIPPEVEGYAVRVEQTGEFRALDTD